MIFISQLFSWPTPLPPFLIYLLKTLLTFISLAICPCPLASFLFCLIGLNHNINRAFLQVELGWSTAIINPLIHSLNKYILSAPHMPGTILDPETSARTKQTSRFDRAIGGSQEISVKVLIKQQMAAVLFYSFVWWSSDSWAGDIQMN